MESNYFSESVFEELPIFYDTDNECIPFFDGSKFDAYIDYNLKIKNKIGEMSNYIRIITKRYNECKNFTNNLMEWSNYWMKLYKLEKDKTELLNQQVIYLTGQVELLAEFKF